MSLFFLQLRGELWKLFARKRTHLGFGVFFTVEVLILFLLQLPGPRRGMQRMIESNGGLFSDYFSGLTLSVIMLWATSFLLGSLFLGLVGGDIVAKEVEDGTMRMTLCRPVSRLRVLLVKYVTVIIYTFSLIFFIGLSALAVASLVRGSGGMFVMIPEERIFSLFSFRTGLTRYLLALPCLALSFLTMTSFAFHLSCWNIKPATATISAITLFFVDLILKNLPHFETYRPWMMTTHMVSWLYVFRTPIPWQQMLESYSYLIGLDATFLILGVLVFSARDFKS